MPRILISAVIPHRFPYRCFRISQYISVRTFSLLYGKSGLIGERNRLSLARRPGFPVGVCICTKRKRRVNPATQENVSSATFCAAPDSQTKPEAIHHTAPSPAKEPSLPSSNIHCVWSNIEQEIQYRGEEAHAGACLPDRPPLYARGLRYRPSTDPDPSDRKSTRLNSSHLGIS